MTNRDRKDFSRIDRLAWLITGVFVGTTLPYLFTLVSMVLRRCGGLE